MSEQVLFFAFILPVLAIVGMLAIWGNWIWLGKDGFTLPSSAQPGFFRFWFSLAPRFLVGLHTGMEDITL